MNWYIECLIGIKERDEMKEREKVQLRGRLYLLSDFIFIL